MATTSYVRQGYRLYGLAVLVWAVWTGLWGGLDLGTPARTIGDGWLLIAAFGVVLTGALAASYVSGDGRLFRTQAKRSQIDRYNDHVLSSTPLHVYMVALLGWSVLSLGWWTGSLSFVGRTAVGYGWLVVALYGLVLAVGLAVKHSSDIAEDVAESVPGARGRASN